MHGPAALGLTVMFKTAGMRISTCKTDAMVLGQKSVRCSLRVVREALPQVEKFKYLGILFTSRGQIEMDIHRQIGATSGEIIHTLNQSVMAKR